MTHYDIDLKEELVACRMNLEDEDRSVYSAVIEEKFPDYESYCISCHKAVPFEEFLETDDKLTLLKKVAEIQGPLDVDYRCIDCRECKKCKDSGKIERISLREELAGDG